MAEPLPATMIVTGLSHRLKQTLLALESTEGPLELSWSFEDADVDALTALLASPAMARVVGFSYCRAYEGYDFDMRSVRDNYDLSGVGSTRTWFTRPAVEALGSGRFVQLRRLSLADSGLDASSLDTVLSAVPALEELDVSSNAIGDQGALRIAGEPRLGNLRRLALRGCEIGENGAAALAASPHLLRLEGLTLSINKIGDEGVRRLAERVALPSLVELHLDSCGITYRGAEALARVRWPASLRRLSLAGNEISDDGGARLSASLSGVETLDLSHNTPSREQLISQATERSAASGLVVGVPFESFSVFRALPGFCHGSHEDERAANQRASERLGRDIASREPLWRELFAHFTRRGHPYGRFLSLLWDGKGLPDLVRVALPLLAGSLPDAPWKLVALRLLPSATRRRYIDLDAESYHVGLPVAPSTPLDSRRALAARFLLAQMAGGPLLRWAFDGPDPSARRPLGAWLAEQLPTPDPEHLLSALPDLLLPLRRRSAAAGMLALSGPFQGTEPFRERSGGFRAWWLAGLLGAAAHARSIPESVVEATPPDAWGLVLLVAPDVQYERLERLSSEAARG